MQKSRRRGGTSLPFSSYQLPPAPRNVSTCTQKLLQGTIPLNPDVSAQYERLQIFLLFRRKGEDGSLTYPLLSKYFDHTGKLLSTLSVCFREPLQSPKLCELSFITLWNIIWHAVDKG